MRQLSGLDVTEVERYLTNKFGGGNIPNRTLLIEIKNITRLHVNEKQMFLLNFDLSKVTEFQFYTSLGQLPKNPSDAVSVSTYLKRLKKNCKVRIVTYLAYLLSDWEFTEHLPMLNIVNLQIRDIKNAKVQPISSEKKNRITDIFKKIRTLEILEVQCDKPLFWIKFANLKMQPPFGEDYQRVQEILSLCLEEPSKKEFKKLINPVLPSAKLKKWVGAYDA